VSTTLYGPALADVWDLFYLRGRGKDYASEADEVARTVLDLRPGASSLLDVGCGTGEHLRALAAHFGDVAGLDLSAPMVEVARAKVPRADVRVADMRDFDLGRTFDAVICLNTGVAYLPSTGALVTALARMAAHLEPGGVLLIEPWWFPDRYVDGYIAGDVVRTPERTVSRVSRTRREGDSAHMDIHYVVADAGGIEHFTETHVFGLWTREQYLDAFDRAGCPAEFTADTASGYGMFVGRRPG
jgi:SAM-dependent methyltransferase